MNAYTCFHHHSSKLHHNWRESSIQLHFFETHVRIIFVGVFFTDELHDTCWQLNSISHSQTSVNGSSKFSVAKFSTLVVRNRRNIVTSSFKFHEFACSNYLILKLVTEARFFVAHLAVSFHLLGVRIITIIFALDLHYLHYDIPTTNEKVIHGTGNVGLDSVDLSLLLLQHDEYLLYGV